MEPTKHPLIVPWKSLWTWAVFGSTIIVSVITAIFGFAEQVGWVWFAIIACFVAIGYLCFVIHILWRQVQQIQLLASKNTVEKKSVMPSTVKTDLPKQTELGYKSYQGFKWRVKTMISPQDAQQLHIQQIVDRLEIDTVPHCETCDTVVIVHPAYDALYGEDVIGHEYHCPLCDCKTVLQIAPGEIHVQAREAIKGRYRDKLSDPKQFENFILQLSHPDLKSV